MKNNKKAVELTLQTVIIFILLLIVLIVMISFFVKNYSSNASVFEDAGNQAIENAKTFIQLRFNL